MTVQHVDLRISQRPPDRHAGRALRHVLHPMPRSEGGALRGAISVQQTARRPRLQHGSHPAWIGRLPTEQEMAQRAKRSRLLRSKLIEERSGQEQHRYAILLERSGKCRGRKRHLLRDQDQLGAV